MVRIAQEEIERLKREVDLADLVRIQGIKLKHHGDNLLGLCPWHEDHDPSLVITPKKNLWSCLGACGAGGTVIDWVIRRDGVTFREAVVRLQRDSPPPRNGSTHPAVPDEPPVATDPVAGHELLERVVAYYNATLKASPQALTYLKKRGLDHPDLIGTFRLGFADRTLTHRLPGRTTDEGKKLRKQLSELGIFRARSGAEHLNGSLVIPVFDEHGHVGELYGRKIRDDLRTGTAYHLYLPGPHRGVFNLEALRSSKEVILCESLIDALTFWSAGFPNVTSSFGTNGFTAEMLEAFLAYGVERVLIAYDRDTAGDAGAKEVAAKLGGEGISCFRVLFPRHMDANEYATKMKPASRSLEVLLRAAEHISGPMVARSFAGPSTTLPPENPIDTCVMTEEEAIPPLAAASTPEASVKTQEIPGSSPGPASEVAAEVKDNEVVITLEDRRWRIRGLERNMSTEQLRINLLVSQQGAETYHVDTFDLYAHRYRKLFVKHAASEIGVKEEVIKKDLGKVLMKLEALQEERIRAALSPKGQQVELTPAERAEAEALLEAPDLLERVLDAFDRCGVVGEETNKLVGYLVATSRKLAEPLAALIQSSSAAGKSALMNAVLSLIPPEERVQYSAMTGQSLFYMGEADLQHKVLAIAEEEGAERASYALKLLQSEGELSIASTGKDPSSGRLVTQEYHVEGPVAIFLTTTAIDVDEELANRCIVLAVDEGREQTRAIHRLQREKRTLDGLLGRRDRDRTIGLLRNAQRLLQPIPIVNPYAHRLTFLDIATRTRRDHEKYLSLIDAITLLHQRQRTRKQVKGPDGQLVEYIEATTEDIAAANHLAAEVLGRTLDELPPQTRRLLELVEAMIAAECELRKISRSDYRFSRRNIREHTGWSLSQVSVHLRRLVEMEYVLVHHGGRGQSFVYELLWEGWGTEGEPFLIGLIDPDNLDPRPESLTHDPDLAEKGEGVTESEANLTGPKRPQNGPKTGPKRSQESASTAESEELPIDSLEKHQEDAYKGAQKTARSCENSGRVSDCSSLAAAAGRRS